MMYTVLTVLLLSSLPSFAGSVVFQFTSLPSNYLTFSGGAVNNPNGGEISLDGSDASDLPVANQAFFTVGLSNPNLDPAGALNFLIGSIVGGPWTVSNYSNLGGIESADLTGTSTMYLYNASNNYSGDGVSAQLTINRIVVDNSSSGTLRANVSVNIGPWQAVGTPSSSLNNLLNANPAVGLATVSFDLNTTSFASLMNSVTGNTRLFAGSVSHVPEPGFYGILAAGLGSLIWAFRRRNDITA